jgi:hypothetical protein
MPRLIQDEFTDLPISRQRRYQLRCEANGRCRLCGRPAVADVPYCRKHYDDKRRAAREVDPAKPDPYDCL